MDAIQKNYAIALLLDFHQKAASLPDAYPCYYMYECNLDNPRSLHLQLIDNGFLIPSSTPDFLASLKVTDLKQLLKSYNLKISGKKDDLISRLLTNLSDTDIQDILQNNKPCYSLSLKGQLFLRNYKDYIQFWTIPYLNASAKWSFERGTDGMYATDQIFSK